jgi:hypothetical protein
MLRHGTRANRFQRFDGLLTNTLGQGKVALQWLYHPEVISAANVSLCPERFAHSVWPGIDTHHLRFDSHFIARLKR